MPETKGQQLKQVREAKGLTIQKVVQATRIRAHYIEALELDDLESMPSPIQARAFFKLYAEYLGISLDQVVSSKPTSTNELPVLTSITDHETREANKAITTSDEPEQDGSLTIWDKLKFRLNLGKRYLPDPGQSNATTEPPDQTNRTLPADSKEVKTDGMPVFTGGTLQSDQLQSRVILNTIGSTLRQRRESLSLTPDEVERHTHIRNHYIIALETGEFDLLPSSVQARGILNNYARFLDLDVDALLLQYAESLQVKRRERLYIPEGSSGKPGVIFPFKKAIPINFITTLQRYISIDMLVGGGLILLFLVFAVWGTSRVINLHSELTPQPTAPSISSILSSAPDPVPATASPAITGTGISINALPPGVTPILTLPTAGQGAVNLVVIAEVQAWVRVTVDGKVAFEGRVTPGTAYPYDGNSQIEVLTGNGIAISILYNQTNLGPMGNLGEVVDRIYTSKAILLPTSTFTPTPTITPSPTLTLRTSATLRPSATKRPSSTPKP